MEKLINWIKHVLTDNDGNASSKRVIGILASLILFVVVLVNLFTDLTIDEFVYEGLMWVIIATVGTSVAEKFAGTKKKAE